MWIYKSAIYFLVSPMMSSSPFNDQCSRSKNITPLFPPNQPFTELSFREILSRFPKNKPNYLFSAVAAIVCRVVPLPLIVLVSFPFCFRSFRLFLSLCSGSFDGFACFSDCISFHFEISVLVHRVTYKV